jgi:hypothetical protein
MSDIFYKVAIFFRDMCYYLLYGTVFFSGGFIIVNVFISNLLNIDFKKINKTKTLESDNEEEEMEFEEEYKQELEAVTEWKEIFTEDELKELRENNIYIETPNGDVIMFYDYENEAFHYYSDSKTHTFKALETVARKYVLDYDCKALYHDMDKELEELKEKAEEEKAEEEEKAKAEKAEAEKEKNDGGWNPFANFKNYKTEKKENNTIKIKKKINKFKYLGRIDEYKNNCNENEKKQDFVEINYSSYKKKNE